MPDIIKNHINQTLLNELPAVIHLAVERNPVLQRIDLVYVESNFFCTTKMRCYDFYKPII